MDKNAIRCCSYRRSVNDHSRFLKESTCRYLFRIFRLTGGSYVLAPEVQADAFNAVADFSNKYGELHRWTFESTNSTVETIWSNYYAAIGRVNFFIDGVGKIDENPEIELTETQRQQINVYEGEAYFTRAYCYFYLATLFCRDYDVATAASTPGLPLQVKYEPKTFLLPNIRDDLHWKILTNRYWRTSKKPKNV